MRPERAEKGVHVIIKDDISETDRRHSSCMEMFDMRGRMVTIDTVNEDHRGDISISAGGYTWYYGDLKEVCPRKKSQEFHFDLGELTI